MKVSSTVLNGREWRRLHSRPLIIPEAIASVENCLSQHPKDYVRLLGH
ncbi:hypothetical protein AP9108_18370 [Arthrospira sp. PCC 9108]|nr:hypothetical protein AP9108_18370 [Arthrospira sp. PCC 9108]